MTGNTRIQWTLALDTSNYDAQLAAAASKTNSFGQTAGTAVQPLNASWSQFFTQFKRGAEEAEPKVKDLGVSAKQTAAAMRMLPAQITDITTSLASGMPVWLVAIQQGGQLKDSFGGVGPAFKAITGAITPLVAGLGTLAVVGGSVAAAYYQGSKEGDEFRRSLILTGNASGTTAAQMDDMARRAAGAAESTRGATAAAVAQLAGTGQVAGDQLERFSAAAVRWEKATGIAVASTAEQFKALGKDPVAATIKLNEETNFLTKEVWAQITALERQGKTSEAAALAQGAWADTIESRAKDMQASLGYLERGWDGITGAAKKAWDAMLDIGRTQSTGGKLDDAAQQVAYARNKLEHAQKTGFSDGVVEKARQALAVALQNQSVLQENERLERRAATLKAEQTSEAAAAVTWERQGQKYLTDRAKMEQEITAARELGKQAGVDTAVVEQRIAGIRASYAKKGGENQELTAYQNLVAAIKQKTEAARQEALQGAGLTESQRFQITLDEALASGKLELTDARKKHVQQIIEELAVVERENKGDQQRQKGLNALVDEELEARKALDEVNKRRMSLWQQESNAATRSLETARDSHDLATLEFSLLGKSSKERQVTIDLRRIELALAQEIKRIEGLDVVADAKNDLRKKAHDLADVERAAAVSKATLAEASAFIESVDQTAHDAFVSVAKDGVNAFERIGDSLQSSVLDVLYQLTLKRWTVSIAAQISGGGSAVGSSEGSSGGSNLLGNLASSATGFGSYLSTGFMNTVAGTGTAATWGAGQALLGAGQTAGGMGMMAGAALPWIAGAAAVLSILDGLDDSGTYHTGGAASAGPSGVRQGVTAESLGMASTVVADATTKAMEETAASMAAMFNGLGLGDFNVSTAFADDTSKDGAWGALRIERDGQKLLDWSDTQTSRWAPKEFADGEKGMAQYTAALAVSVRDALEQVGLPGWATNILDALGEAPTFEQISGVMQAITVVDQTMDTLGLGMSAFADISDETVTALAEATGGIANLQAGLGYFYQEFFSEAERLDIATQQTTAGLAELGQEMPTSRAAFREMVNAALEAGDSELVAGLLSFSGAVATILPATEDATAALEQQTAAARSATDEAFSVLQRSVAAEQTRLRTAASVASESVSSLTGLINTIKGGIDALYSGVESVAAQRAAQGKAFISQALATARVSGYLPESAALGDAISAVTADPTQYANSTAAAYERLKTSGQLMELRELGGEQLDTASRQLRALQDQIDQNDQLLDFARTQIDELRGVNTNVLTVAEAMQKFYDRTFEEGAFAPKVVAGTSSSGASGGGFTTGGGGGSGIYDTEAERLAASIAAWEASGKPWTVVYNPSGGLSITGASQDKPLLDVQEEWLRKAGVPGFDVGTDYVPRDMLAMIHQGEQIVPRAYNPHANAQLSNNANDQQGQLMRELIREVSKAREVARETADILKRVTRDGNGMVTLPPPL